MKIFWKNYEIFPEIAWTRNTIITLAVSVVVDVIANGLVSEVFVPCLSAPQQHRTRANSPAA